MVAMVEVATVIMVVAVIATAAVVLACRAVA